MGLNLSYSLADQDFHHTKSLGVWNVSTQLLKHLAERPEVQHLTVFTNRRQSDLALPGKAILLPCNAASSGRLGRIYWDQWGVYAAAKRSGNPWLFLPKGFASALRRSPVRVAAYVHDAMHVHYHRHYRDNPLSREYGYFTRSLKATLKTAEIIFTNTDFTRSEIRRLAEEWGITPPHMICAGVGFEAPEPNYEHVRRRIVVLAGPWPHKCTPLTIERLNQWVTERGFNEGVDWIGALPPKVTLPRHPNWTHHVRLSPEEYEQALHRAAVLVYFSAYEGFGMPPVEGTVAGAAAVYSAIPAMIEVMGDCGFRFNNDSYEGFARAMDHAFLAKPEVLAAWRQQLTQRHNWPTVVDRIVTELTALETRRASQPARAARASGTQRKLLVFAHTPPPHHGQSYMVGQMLSGFGGDQRKRDTPPPSPHGIACYHVNARLSRHFEDIGEIHASKLFVLLWYCIQAVWCAFRHRPEVFYYVPAPGKKAALWRDWMVMTLCRPFYPRLILHWHAAGLGHWLDTSANRATRAITRMTLGRAALSIVISDFNRVDAKRLHSLAIARVDYGIPDPCPDFTAKLLPHRTDRAGMIRARLTGSSGTAPLDSMEFNVLFLANCLRTKGVFDALDAFLMLRERIGQAGLAVHPQFKVGGAFGSDADEREFKQRISDSGAGDHIEYLGFVSGEKKDHALQAADMLCFPTYYPGENQPLVLIESLAYGLPAVTTDWRSIPDILPPKWKGIVPVQDVPATAEALWQLLPFADHAKLRSRFENHFTLPVHLRKLADAIRSVA